MHSRTRSTAAVAALAIAAGARLAGLAGPAHAAQSTLPINLRRAVAYRAGQYQYSSKRGGWGVGQIVVGGTGHLVPTEISGSLVDNAINQNLFTFDQVKGGGNANHHQPTLTCTAACTALGRPLAAPFWLFSPGCP